MKHLRNFTLIFVIFISSSFTAFAQSKVAHINTQELIQSMPKTVSAQSELNKLIKSYQTDIEAMRAEAKIKEDKFKSEVSEYQSKMKQYQSEEPNKSKAENLKRQQEVDKDGEELQKQQEELQGFAASIGQYEAQAQQEIQKKQIELFKPIAEEAKKAILKVGKEKGYDYVLDSSENSGVIMAEGKDLMADVKAELGF